MAKIIILIGKTGSGKSALANVISGTNKFVESGVSSSVTKDIQKEKFTDTDNNISYVVIDTVGIGDTQLKKEEVLDKIAKAVYLARKGVSQILFVTDGRFDQFEMSTYNLLKTIIFDELVTDYTTIVRTSFPEFYDEEACQTDVKEMLNEGELCNIINSCQRKIIHVSNPPVERKSGKELKMNEEERAESREKLLDYLQKKLLEQKEVYTPKKLKKLSDEIADYMEQKIESENKLAEKERKRLAEQKKAEEKLKEIANQDDKDEPESVSLENITEDNAKNQEVADHQEVNLIEQLKQEDPERSYKAITKLRISISENEIKELKKIKELKEGIRVADRAIRQKVFSHIFNNIDDVAQVIGADVFLNSIVSDNDNPFASKLSFAELRGQRKELEEKLSKQGGNDQSLEKIKDEIEKKEQELLNLKKQLLNDKEVLEK